MQTNTNVINEPSGVHRRRMISLVITAAVIILAVGGVWLYKNHHKAPQSRTVVESSALLAQQELKSKDYKAYQLRLSVDADDFIARGDYKNAEKSLNEITQTVPADKITSDTYRSYWSLYDKTGDVQNRKKYALLTAQKLRAEGQGAAAFAFEQDAKGN